MMKVKRETRILVVDDDPDVRKLMGSRLRQCGYDVGFAGDGVAAMVGVRKQKPDLVLLDLGIPAGDGFKTLERLRKAPETEAVPVIVLTGRDADVARDRALAAGASAFFEKGVTHEELLAEIWRQLESMGLGARRV